MTFLLLLLTAGVAYAAVTRCNLQANYYQNKCTIPCKTECRYKFGGCWDNHSARCHGNIHGPHYGNNVESYGSQWLSLAVLTGGWDCRRPGKDDWRRGDKCFTPIWNYVQGGTHGRQNQPVQMNCMGQSQLTIGIVDTDWSENQGSATIEADCPEPESYGPWVDGTCDVKCGAGTQTNTRTCTQGGAPCANPTQPVSTTVACDMGSCVDEQCGWMDADGNFGVHTGITKASNGLQCQDGHMCGGSNCCRCHGGRFRCPSDFPYMCENTPPGPFKKADYYICAHMCIGPFGTDRKCDDGFVPHPGGEYAADSPECKPAVDCVLGDEVKDGDCSETCGEGTQKFIRPIEKDPENGGKPCGVRERTATCKVKECPIDCILEDEVDQGCSEQCGEGTQTFTRAVKQAPLHGGKECGARERTVACKLKECPIDCELEDEVDEGCDAECGDGTRTFTRAIKQEPKYGGNECPARSRTEPCKEKECPIDCVLEDEVDQGCSAECGDGTRTYTRAVKQEPLHGGKECPPKSRTVACKEKECPVDCKLGDEVKDGDCSETCGEGTQKFTRPIEVEPAHGGKECEERTRTASCKVKECPVDCKLGEEVKDGDCSETCGEGTQKFTKPIEVEPAHGGKECEERTRTASCNLKECPYWLDYGEWQDCSATCKETEDADAGTQIRTRECSSGTSTDCGDDFSETRECGTEVCPCNEGATLNLVNPTTVTVESTIPSDCEEFCDENANCVWWSMTGQDCSMAAEKKDEPPAPTPESESGAVGCGATTTPLVTPSPTSMPVPDPTGSPTEAPETTLPTAMPVPDPTGSPTVMPVKEETVEPTVSPTPCKSCRDYDGNKKGCVKDSLKVDYLCDPACVWDKKKNICTEPTCESFTSEGPFKCDKLGKKFLQKFGAPADNGNGIAGPCHWNPLKEKCDTHMVTEEEFSCSQWFEALGKKGCKKLGKPYAGCKWSTTFKICLGKDEEVSCPSLGRNKCKGRCVMTSKGGCLDKAEYECKDLGVQDCTDDHRAKLIKKGCVWQNRECHDPKDLTSPTEKPTDPPATCADFNGKARACQGEPLCSWDKKARTCNDL